MSESGRDVGGRKRSPHKRIWFLLRLNLFEEVPSATSALPRDSLKEHRYRRAERIGGEAAEVCIVKSGRVRVRWLRDGGARGVSTLLVPGQLFGIGDALGIGETGSLEAAVPTVLMCGSMEGFLNAVSGHVQVHEALPYVLVRHLYRLERRVELAHAQRVPMRVAGILHELSQENRRRSGQPLVVTTHTDIARMVGTTRESVSRIIAFLKEEEVIAGRSVLRVIDPERLRAFAGEGETGSTG